MNAVSSSSFICIIFVFYLIESSSYQYFEYPLIPQIKTRHPLIKIVFIERSNCPQCVRLHIDMQSVAQNVHMSANNARLQY